ncbi:AfsR/SARP family transcriptional regulator [Actinomadura rupiterrae]|uniref:AfsR/SARP family transcriptional regulator n=1 Tax=Actinomadura rupiterrae TaxID=559627 RepID=UPI0020A594D9|nr:AfsR/SARP family transcriptional regulator [Actinomadura rupiterrae]MCP2341062.1 DNA-binding SARP family transcriptional activator [Actinomadura rupiterrae]
MKFQVLGPLEVSGESGDMTPSAPKVREVLALLLLQHGHIVQSRTLIDELWGEDPPPSALATLQTYIYKLRKVLMRGRSGESLRTKVYGYVLSVPADDLDHCRFERLLADGQGAFDAGDLERATGALGEGLALWRGPALADVDSGPILSAEVTRLEERRLRALELRIDADLGLGRHQELVSELKTLISTHPLHEAFHAKLMLALQGAGRRYEALDVYQRLRSTLVAELGLEPSASLSRLHQSLLSSDYAPEPPARRTVVLAMSHNASQSIAPDTTRPASQNPGHNVSQSTTHDDAQGAPRGGGRTGGRVATWSGADGSADEGPAIGRPSAHQQASGHQDGAPVRQSAPVAHHEPSAPLRPAAAASAEAARHGDGRPDTARERTPGPSGALLPAQLPPDIADFTGREDVIERLAGHLLGDGETACSVRVASIVGMAGIGKTALAVHLAHRVAHAFPDGQFFVGLGSVGDDDEGTGEVLRQTLRAAGLSAAEIAPTTEERAKQFRSWAAGRRVLMVLDDAESAAQITRLVPGTPGCAVLVTGRSYGLPASTTVALDVLDRREGLDLLAEIIGRWRVEVESAAAQRIVEMCGALPLALRAAGMRLVAASASPLERFADELEGPRDRFNALRIGDLDPRAAFAASYERAGERERSVFHLLALLPAVPFTAARAASLLGCDRASAEAVLGRLVEHHLLRAERRGQGEPLHYALPELCRVYARERLEQIIEDAPAPRHQYAPRVQLGPLPGGLFAEPAFSDLPYSAGQPGCPAPEGLPTDAEEVAG